MIIIRNLHCKTQIINKKILVIPTQKNDLGKEILEGQAVLFIHLFIRTMMIFYWVFFFGGENNHCRDQNLKNSRNFFFFKMLANF